MQFYGVLEMYGEFHVPSFVEASRCYKTSSFFFIYGRPFRYPCKQILGEKIEHFEEF